VSCLVDSRDAEVKQNLHGNSDAFFGWRVGTVGVLAVFTCFTSYAAIVWPAGRTKLYLGSAVLTNLAVSKRAARIRHYASTE